MHVALLVKVGVGAALHADDVNLGAAGEGVLQHAAGLHAAHLGTHESGTLARFDMKEFNNRVDVVVEVDAKSVFNISRCCHCVNYVLLFILRRDGLVRGRALSVFLLLLGIELGELAQILLQFLVLGIGGQPTGALHHQPAKNGQHQHTERQVERPRPMAAENKIKGRGTEDQDVRNPLVNL